MLDLSVKAVAGIVLLSLASYQDLKTREVPDLLSYSLIILGLAWALIRTVLLRDLSPLARSVSGLAIATALAYFMFYAKQWGGGDSKLLIGMGALLGFNPSKPLLLFFVFNLFLAGAAYGLLWSAWMAFKNKESFAKRYSELARSGKAKAWRYFNLALSVPLLASALYFKEALLVGVAVLVTASLYAWLFVKSVEDSCMYKRVKVEDLVEGDWVAEEVVFKGRVVCSPKGLGLTKQQLEELRELKKKKVLREVLVKEGVPFVPSFLAGFILTLAFQGWMSAFLG